MSDDLVVIDVVAHRVFGTQYRIVETGIGGHGDGLLQVSDVGYRHPVRMPMAFPDHDHGTARSEAEIRALFLRDPGYEYPHDTGLNDMFAPFGIRFRLLRLMDDMIDSHLADLVPQDSLEGISRQNNLPYVLNAYFVRELRGAYGKAAVFSRDAKYPTFAFVADRHGVNAFGLSLVTLAHELGHVLSLPHMPSPENVMYNSATLHEPGLTMTQKHLARHHAKLFLRENAGLSLREGLGRPLPSTDLFRDWHAPLEDG